MPPMLSCSSATAFSPGQLSVAAPRCSVCSHQNSHTKSLTVLCHSPPTAGTGSGTHLWCVCQLCIPFSLFLICVFDFLFWVSCGSSNSLTKSWNNVSLNILYKFKYSNQKCQIHRHVFLFRASLIMSKVKVSSSLATVLSCDTMALFKIFWLFLLSRFI